MDPKEPPKPAPASSDPTAPSAIVDSLLHPLALPIRQLLTRPGRIEFRQILIDDEENILQALEAGVTVRSVYFAGEEILSESLRKKLPAGVPFHEVARRTCKKLFENDKISRIFAIADMPAPLSLDSLAGVPGDIVVLEDLSISGNIGAIIRTSLALGAGGIVLLNADPVDIYDRRLIRASRGYVFSLPVVTASTQALVGFCQQGNLDLLVTAAHAERQVNEIASLPRRLFIVFGAEKEGVSGDLAAAATLQVRIPTDPRVESLNVSAAAGIVLFNRSEFNQGGKPAA